MGEDLIVESEFESLSLLDDVEGEAFEGEGVLKGDVGRKFVLEEHLAVDCDFDFPGDEGEVEYDAVLPVLEGDIPAISLLAALHVLPYLLHFEPQSLDLLHLNKYVKSKSLFYGLLAPNSTYSPPSCQRVRPPRPHLHHSLHQELSE